LQAQLTGLQSHGQFLACPKTLDQGGIDWQWQTLAYCGTE
jgi:hypothetical protein